MKKLLLVTLLTLVGLGSISDAFGIFGSRRRAYRRGYYAGSYGDYYNGSNYRASECGSCYKGCDTGCAEECPPPPCCEREQVITVREAPRKVCGWVCPDGTSEIPTSEARLVND